MRDQELDTKLKQARKEANQFFAGWTFGPLHKVVHRRTQETAGTAVPSRGRFLVWARTLLAATAALLLLCLPGQPGTDSPASPRLRDLGAGLDQPVSQYTLNLKDSTKQQLSFFRLSHPAWPEDRLLAVIWEQDRPTAPNKYRLLYSTTFGSGVNPEPAQRIQLPGSNTPLALIATRNPTLEYLHYRVIGYDGKSVTSYWEQDFVPGGQLEVHAGVLVERRRTDVNLTSNGHSVNFLVPYQVDTAGNLLLPVQRLQMEVGQYLTFIGTQEKALQTDLEGMALDRIQSMEGEQTAAHFRAVQSGTEMVELQPRNSSGPGGRLLIEVVEPGPQ
jgi:hypothetical protein